MSESALEKTRRELREFHDGTCVDGFCTFEAAIARLEAAARLAAWKDCSAHYMEKHNVGCMCGLDLRAEAGKP